MAGLGQEKPKYTNEHNVYVRTGVASLNQLNASIASFKNALSRYPDPAINKLAKSEIEANIVSDINEKSLNFGYLWAENPQVYWILCGYNPDGSERIEVLEEEDDIDFDNIDISNMDLSSIMDVTQKDKPKKVKQLPPLIPFPGYEYTEVQKKNVLTYMQGEEDKLAVSEGREPRTVPEQKYGYFELTRSSTFELSADQRSNLIRGKVPRWVTVDILYNLFAKFAITPPFKVANKIDRDSGKEVHHFGPHFKIHMSDGGVKNQPEMKIVMIDYHQSVYGTGIFANQMRRKTYIKNPKPISGQKEVEACIFDYYRDRKDDNGQGHDTRSGHASGHASGHGPRTGNFFNRASDTGFSTRSAKDDDGFTTVSKR